MEGSGDKPLPEERAAKGGSKKKIAVVAVVIVLAHVSYALPQRPPPLSFVALAARPKPRPSKPYCTCA